MGKQSIMDFNIKTFMQSAEYQQKRYAIQREINSTPVIIDRSVFRKTKEEKEALAIAKLTYKNKHK